MHESISDFRQISVIFLKSLSFVDWISDIMNESPCYFDLILDIID